MTTEDAKWIIREMDLRSQSQREALELVAQNITYRLDAVNHLKELVAEGNWVKNPVFHEVIRNINEKLDNTIGALRVWIVVSGLFGGVIGVVLSRYLL